MFIAYHCYVVPASIFSFLLASDLWLFLLDLMISRFSSNQGHGSVARSTKSQDVDIVAVDWKAIPGRRAVIPIEQKNCHAQ